MAFCLPSPSYIEIVGVKIPINKATISYDFKQAKSVISIEAIGNHEYYIKLVDNSLQKLPFTLYTGGMYESGKAYIDNLTLNYNKLLYIDLVVTDTDARGLTNG